jgi:hypothetical protein
MKVTKLSRRFTVTAAAWATGDWTLTTSAAHGLTVGDVITFTDAKIPVVYVVATIAGTTGSTIKFTHADTTLKFNEVTCDSFSTGVAESNVFTFSFVDTINGLVHVVSNGTATVTAKLQGSLDNIHWVDHGTATAVTAGSQLEIPVTKPYAYGKIVFTVAPANSSGAINNIKVFKAGC